MLRRTFTLTSLAITFMLLLFFALGVPVKSLFASALTQADGADEATALSQPMTITVRQQIPFTITLVTSQVITQGETVTDTVTEPLTQTTVITLDLESVVAVSQTGVISSPLSIKLRSSQLPTGTFPVDSKLVIARNLLTQLGIELPPLPEPSEELTATESLTATSDLTATTELTASEEITSSEELTGSEELTTTAEITGTAEATATEEAGTVTPVLSNATLTALANVRSETNLEATSIVTQVAAGTPISIVAQSADQSWLLLDSGYWVSVLVVDAVPTGLPTATDAQIAALREAAAQPPAAATPEATATPTATVTPTATSEVSETVQITSTPEITATAEITTSSEVTTSTEPAADATPAAPGGPTITVDANLRSGPGTEFPVIGGTITGDALTIVGRNADASWYRLSNGGWVLGRLVANPPANADVPLVDNDGTPIEAPVNVPTPTAEPFLLPTPTPTS